MAQPQVFDFRKRLKKVSVGGAGKAKPPQFNLPLLNLGTEKGKKATLRCTVVGNPLPQVKWLFNGNPLTNESNGIKYWEDKKAPGTHILEIASVNPMHAGEYVCEATNAGGVEKSTSKLTLKKQSKPVIVTGPDSKKVHKATSLKLKAKIEGTPTPTIKWYRNNMVITEKREIELTSDGNNEYELIIYNVNDNHSGTYKVEATNVAGTDSVTCKVDIIEQMKKPTFESPLKSSGKPTAGGDLKLGCRIDGNPKPKVRWLKDGVEVDPAKLGVEVTCDPLIGKHDLVFKNFGVEHVGEYTIEAESDAGKEVSTLRVAPDKAFLKPRVEQPLSNAKIQQGEPAKLVTKAVGEPMPKITWYKDGKEITPDTPGVDVFIDEETGETEIYISKLSEEFAGKYTCKMTSPLGTVETTANIVAVEPPPAKPTFEIPLVATFDPTKNLLILRTKAVGYPPPDLEWTYNNNVLKPSDENNFKDDPSNAGAIIFQISNFTEAKEGDYTVTAKNKHGTTSKTLTIKIKQTKTENTNRPQFEKPVQVDFDPEKGCIFLTCKLVGDPKPDIKWLRDNKEIVPNEDFEIKTEDGLEKLIISNVSSAHHGDYSCMGTNVHGMSKQTCTLMLREKPKVEMVSRPQLEFGKPFELSFLVTGGENFTVKWSKNDIEIEPSDEISTTQKDNVHTLMIKSLSDAHAGDYSIEVCGDGGTVKSTISLNFSAQGAAGERGVVVIELDKVAINEITKLMEDNKFKCSAGKITKVRLDSIKSQFANNMEAYNKIVASLPDGPIFLGIFEGKGVVEFIKKQMSGDVAAFKKVHYSTSSVENSKKEVNLWFKPFELIGWKLSELNF